MTTTNMDLKELLENTADTDFLREMIGFTAQRLMDLEVETRAGTVHLQIPKSAKAVIFPASWNRGG